MKIRWTVLVSSLVLLVLAGRGLSEENAAPPEQVGADEMFTRRVLVAKGEGLAPDRPLSQGQRRLMAQEAAKAVAFKNLAEVLSGVRVSGETSVKDLELQSSQINAKVEGMVRGARVVYESYNPNEGSAAVYLRVNLDGDNGVAANLLPAIVRQDLSGLRELPAYKSSGAAPPPEAVDGLIVDATGSGLRPALVNRIIAADGSALFEPSKIAPEILAKKGCGEYTNEIGKAKAILGEHGARNPLVVKVTGVQHATDAQVSEDDAAAIFAANQRSSFLQSAKVVFVL